MKRKKSQKPGIGWKSHLAFFSVINIQTAIDFFINRESLLYQYHHIILTFDPEYLPVLILNGITIALNVLCLIPYFLFVYRKRFLPPVVWKWLLLARFVFEFYGHRYEILFIKATYYSSALLGIEIALISLVIMFPSYLACYLYAFEQDKIISRQMNLFK